MPPLIQYLLLGLVLLLAATYAVWRAWQAFKAPTPCAGCSLREKCGVQKGKMVHCDMKGKKTQ